MVSPDHALFLEQLDGNNAELSGLRFGDGAWNLPVGLPGREEYAFQPRLVGTALAGLLPEGALFAAERQARGLTGAPRGVPVAGGAQAILVIPGPRLGVVGEGGVVADPAGEHRVRAGGAWVLDEPVGNFEVGLPSRSPGSTSAGARLSASERPSPPSPSSPRGRTRAPGSEHAPGRGCPMTGESAPGSSRGRCSLSASWNGRRPRAPRLGQS